MKNNLVRVSILVLGAAAGYAQSLSPVKADIPFEFNANGVTLRAGTYSVDTATPAYVVLRSRDNNANAIVRASAAETLVPQKDARLVFNRYGHQYFLTDIWITGSNIGRHLPMTPQERKLAKGRTQPDEVIIAALR